MRRLIGLLLLAAVGYFIYTQFFPKPSNPQFTLPDKIAWRSLSRNSDGARSVDVSLVNGDRWRVENWQGGSRTIVAVFDGAKFVSNPNFPSAKPDLFDPRPEIRKLLESFSGKVPDATEPCDGHTCWRFHETHGKDSIRVWIDTKSHFLVCHQGTLAGEQVDWHYERLDLDLDRNAAQYFSANSLIPLFPQLLKVQ